MKILNSPERWENLSGSKTRDLNYPPLRYPRLITRLPEQLPPGTPGTQGQAEALLMVTGQEEPEEGTAERFTG